jgi:hypothetical protein
MKSYLKYSLLALTAALVLSMVVCGGLAVPAQAAGTTYYVDCSAGSNGNGSQSSPWNNLGTVNGTTFSAGDSILFQRGTTCSGQLWPKGSGASGSPITIGAYGSGALPIINGGSNTSAIKIYNQEYWEIQDIETTGGAPWGIYIAGDVSDVLDYFRISNVVVHDVGGTVNDKETGLIVITPEAANTTFNDVIIDGATVHDTTQWAGIIVGQDDFGRSRTSPRSTNITIRNSLGYNIYGDGMVLYQVNNGVMENSVTYETGNQPTETIGTPNAIWTWMCGDCTVQFTEAYLAASPGVDGGAYDIDYGCSDNYVQYNYAHDNDAYCYAVFATQEGMTDYSIVRYNICSNNARNGDLSADRNADVYLAVWSSGKVENLIMHNNTHYWNPANTSDHYAVTFFDLWRGCCLTGANYFLNNIVYSTVPKMVYMEDTNITFDYNLYWYTGAGDPVFKWGHRNYTGFSAWQSGSGQDANGMYADPKMNDPTYHGVDFPTTQFTLQSDSPAINAGVDVAGMTWASDNGARDFFGNSIPNGAYDIGAHEYGGGPPPTDTPVPPTDTPAPTNTPGGPTDTPVPPTDTPEPTPTNTPGGATIFSDGFEDGDMSDWTVSNGDAQVRTDDPYTGSYHAGAKRGAWFKHTVSTVGYTNIHLKYAGRTKGFDSGEFLTVEWYDGSTWHVVDELNNETYLPRDWTLPAGAADNAAFAVRFTANADKNTEWGYADNIEVTGQ